MPNKCCVLGCRTGIGTKKNEKPLFRLPSKDDPERRQKWISVLLAQNDGLLCISDNTAVCEDHWPVGYIKCRKSSTRHETPFDPP